MRSAHKHVFRVSSFCWIVLAATLFCSYTPCSAASLVSYFPKSGLEEFIVKNLDLHSINAFSYVPGAARFSDEGLLPSKVTKGHVELENSEMYYNIVEMTVGDFNGDGIEDVAVCLTIEAKHGVYRAQWPLLLTKYSKDTPLIALERFPADKGDCTRWTNSDGPPPPR